MNTSSPLTRKIIYITAIALLLLPIAALSQPATISPGQEGNSPGGKLAQLRARFNLAQAELGEIDPASETMKLSTLGLRGVAANILWGWANYYKKIEDWDKLEMTVNQIIRLQPNFVEVWDFQAHNLSYNVSVEFDDYRMRYQWVKKGIEFLILGSHYNRGEPGILSQLGWFTGQKIGRADEHVQFRRMFRDDKDFHQTFRENGIEVDNGLGPDQKPDNWLVGKLWYLKAEDSVTFSGKPIRGRTPLLFYSGAPMSEMNSGAAMNKDGYFETALYTWHRAGANWKSYGERELPTSVGFNIRLNEKEARDRRIAEAQAAIDKLCPGVREKIREEKLAKLSPEKKAALETPADKRTSEQYSLVYEADQELKVQPHDFLGRAAKAEDRPEVRKLVDQIDEDELYSRQVELNRRIVNFAYWRTRTEAETIAEKPVRDAEGNLKRDEKGQIVYEACQPIAPQAHQKVYDADKLFASGENLSKARELYEQAWKLYAELFEMKDDAKDRDFSVLMDNAEAQDLVESVSHYRDLLGQLDEPFPQSFPLWSLLDKHQKGQQIRDQVKLLQGSEATTEKPKEEAKDDKNPEEAKPEEKKPDAN